MAILLKISDDQGSNFAAYKGVVGGIHGSIFHEHGTMNPMARIEIEAAKAHNYIHLRFSHTNKYWELMGDNLVAVSSRPDEDTRSPTCTMFEPVFVFDGVCTFYHVQSGGGVQMEASTYRYLVKNNVSTSRFSFVETETLVKLPKQVAFKIEDVDRY